MAMTLSKFIYTLEEGQHYYLIQTKTRRVFEIKKECYLQIKSGGIPVDYLDESEYKLFQDAEIIIPDRLDEVDILERDCINNDNPNEWHSLHIIPTAACNFGCDYCFVLKDKKSNICDNMISDDILYSGIDFFFNGNESNDVIVTFYGGEPLLTPSVIYKAVDYIENTLKKRVNKKIITNGSLITPEIAEYLAQHEFDVNVSLDGNKKAHDTFRVYKSGKSSYDDVVTGIKLLMDKGNSVKVLMTVGDFNAGELAECVKSILALKPTTVALNLPKALQYSENGIEKNIDYAGLLDAYVQCVDMCYDSHIPEGHMADIIFGFLREKVQYRPCHGCGKQIALTPNGLIGPCQAYLGTQKYFINMKEYKSISDLRENEIFKKWEAITMYSSQKCRSCYLLPVCPGDCPYDWENRSGDLTNPPDTYCKSRKKMFDYMIRRLVRGQEILFKPKKRE